MPFSVDDLERYSVRVGTGTKTLRQMSDTQFTAWLRAHGARGQIGIVNVAPGITEIPLEERVRVLNDLEREGFYLPGVTGSETPRAPVDPERLTNALEHLKRATAELEGVQATIGDLGEIDPRVNMRASIHGAIELVDLMRGAVEHAQRDAGSRSTHRPLSDVSPGTLEAPGA